jgi:hypothetical protein
MAFLYIRQIYFGQRVTVIDASRRVEVSKWKTNLVMLDWEENKAVWVLLEEDLVLLLLLDARCSLNLLWLLTELELWNANDLDSNARIVVLLVGNGEVELLCGRIVHLEALDAIGSLLTRGC